MKNGAVNPETYVKGFLKTLDKTDRWNVYSATRGPDMHGAIKASAKSCITSRIRAIVFPTCAPYTCPGDIRHTPFNSIDLKTLTEYGMVIHNTECMKHYSVQNGVAHFLSHLKQAVIATKKHPIWGGFAEQIEVILEDDVYKAHHPKNVETIY